MMLIPGPVKLTEDIMNAQAKQMISHRSKEFAELYSGIISDLNEMFDAQETYTLTGSGTLGIECILANSIKKDDTVLGLNNGDFSRRMVENARIYCDNVIEKEVEWGKGINLERAKEHIDESNANVLCMAYSETSTGVANKISEICKYAKSKGMVTVVDAVSAFCAMPLSLKNDGIDFVASGSQKAIGAPPGLAFVAMSEEGVKRYEEIDCPNYYCDLKKQKKFMAKNNTPYTPAVATLYGLRVAIDKVKQAGFEENIRRHADAAAYTRDKVVNELGLELFSEEGFHSNTITAFRCESCPDLKKQLQEKHDFHIGGGQNKLKGHVLRIAHLGNFTLDEIGTCIKYMKEILGK